VTGTGPPRERVAIEDVRIYRAPPAEYSVLGNLTGEGTREDVIGFFKASASAFGANGVLFTSDGDSASGGQVPVNGVGAAATNGDAEVVKLQAKAIFVTRETK
jgi:hypothetical protein